jgi:hypothetical protein
LDPWEWSIISNWGLWGISKLIDIILRTKNDSDGIKISRFNYRGEQVFKGEIVNKKDKYERKTDTVIFRAKYEGKIEHGFFAVEIIPPSSFPSNTFHIDNKGNTISFCEKTLAGDTKLTTNIHNIPENFGKLNGRNIKTDWLEWGWKIPEYSAKGEYTVKIGVWNNSNKDNNGKITSVLSIEKSFYVIDSNDSHYQPRVAN